MVTSAFAFFKSLFSLFPPFFLQCLCALALVDLARIFLTSSKG